MRRGADVDCEVTLELREAAKGVARTVKFRRHEKCETCQGTGAAKGSKPETCSYCGGQGQVLQRAGFLTVQQTCPACRGEGTIVKSPCNDCQGHGYVPRKVEHEVRIPAGVDDGSLLRIRGEGEPSPGGGPSGDCRVHIRVRQDKLFHREGEHLICQVPITYAQAALGATIEVPTLEGREELKIPRGTQPGEMIRLRGRGMPDLQGRGEGRPDRRRARRGAQEAASAAGGTAAAARRGGANRSQSEAQELLQVAAGVLPPRGRRAKR